MAAVALAAVASLSLLVSPWVAGPPAPEPRLEVPVRDLAAATTCDQGVADADDVALLVHGTSVTAEENWGWNYAVALPEEGWATCAVTLPARALEDIQVSSEYVVHAIRHAARAAGRPVDVIGISQGGIEVRWAIRWWPQMQALVDDVVMIATPNHGSTFADVSCVIDCLPALWQNRTDAQLLRALNEGDETPGSVDYTSVFSTTDPIIQPSTTAMLDGASNVAVQDVCPGRIVEHAQAVFDAVVHAVVLDALRHAGPAVERRVPRSSCAEVVMPHVDPIRALLGEISIYVTSLTVQGIHPKVAAEPLLAAYARAPLVPTTADPVPPEPPLPKRNGEGARAPVPRDPPGRPQGTAAPAEGAPGDPTMPDSADRDGASGDDAEATAAALVAIVALALTAGWVLARGRGVAPPGTSCRAWLRRAGRGRPA